MLNAIPLLGWFISLCVSISLAVPFWMAWTVFDIGKTFFYWLPEVYRAPGFWECVGLFMVVSILKAVLVPRLASVNNTSESSK